MGDSEHHFSQLRSVIEMLITLERHRTMCIFGTNFADYYFLNYPVTGMEYGDQYFEALSLSVGTY